MEYYTILDWIVQAPIKQDSGSFTGEFLDKNLVISVSYQ